MLSGNRHLHSSTSILIYSLFLNVFPAYFWKCCNLNSDILQDMLEIHLKNDVNKKSTFNLFNTSSTFLCYTASFRENIKYRTTCLLSFFFTLKNIIFWYWNILFLLKSTQLKIGYNNRTVCHLQLLGKKGWESLWLLNAVFLGSYKIFLQRVRELSALLHSA